MSNLIFPDNCSNEGNECAQGSAIWDPGIPDPGFLKIQKIPNLNPRFSKQVPIPDLKNQIPIPDFKNQTQDPGNTGKFSLNPEIPEIPGIPNPNSGIYC